MGSGCVQQGPQTALYLRMVRLEMPIEYHPDPNRYRGQGTVLLAMGRIEDPAITGYWTFGS